MQFEIKKYVFKQGIFVLYEQSKTFINNAKKRIIILLLVINFNNFVRQILQANGRIEKNKKCADICLL